MQHLDWIMAFGLIGWVARWSGGPFHALSEWGQSSFFVQALSARLAMAPQTLEDGSLNGIVEAPCQYFIQPMKQRNTQWSNRQKHDDCFAPVIWSFVSQFKKAEGGTKAKLREGLCVTLQKWTDYPVSMISEEVGRKALSGPGIESPFEMLWPQRNKFGLFGEKSFLVFEHTTPIRIAAGELLECSSEEEVRNYMAGYSGVCWITREEDDRLTREGFRSIRSSGWQACYERCGIKIISPEQFERMKRGDA